MRRLRLQSVLTGIATALLVAGVSGAVAGEGRDGIVVQDPHYGNVLFHFYQQDNFTALAHLVTARHQGRVPHHAQEAELLQGGLLLAWGQHREAGRIFEDLLAASSDPAIRDRAWFYLGKVRYQRGHLSEAVAALESIQNELPPELQPERLDLLARLYMEQGRFADAVDMLSRYTGRDDWAAYARFNTGVALVRLGDLEAGARLLEHVGTMRATDEEQRALRDRANLALGFAYLQARLEGDARPVLQRVRLNGPFSAKALLGVGWADAAHEDYRAALTAWLELSERDLRDSAVQESLLAVPYAFAQLGDETQAAALYTQALDVYAGELGRLDRSLADAAAGRLITSLLAGDQSSVNGWNWQLGDVPDEDASRYLYFTIADHSFHEGLKSYRELMALDRHLDEWADRLAAYRDMVAHRELAYAERLPALQARVAEFDLAAMEADFERLAATTHAARANADALLVAPAAEQDAWQRLQALRDNPAWSAAASAEQREKARVLAGVLRWNMEREFRVRLRQQEQQLALLDTELATARARFASVAAAAGSLDGTLESFTARIDRLTADLVATRAQLNVAMRDYAGHLNEVAVAALGDQQQRLLAYRAQARFELAAIVDRLAARNAAAVSGEATP